MLDTDIPPTSRSAHRTRLPRGRSLYRALFALLALAFFMTPIALRALGDRVKSFENHPFATVPHLSEGFGALDEMTRFLIDRMPLREQAVHANTWIDQNVFGTTPIYGQNGLGGVAADQALTFGRPQQDTQELAGQSASNEVGAPQAPGAPPSTAAQVLVGRDGWLYLQGELDRGCAPFIPFAQALGRWERLLSIVRASGREAILIVAPDKAAIYPEYLPAGYPNEQCGLPGIAKLYGLIESAGASASGIVSLREPLLEAKRASAEALYFRKDSHWNSVGALTMVEQTLDHVGGPVRVQPSEVVRAKPGKYTGDLTILLGAAQSDVTPGRNIIRAATAPKVPGQVAAVGDSYADVALPMMAPYFADIQRLQWVTNTAQQLVQGIKAAHTVVFETVEREFDYRASDAGYVTPRFFEELRRGLTRR